MNDIESHDLLNQKISSILIEMNKNALEKTSRKYESLFSFMKDMKSYFSDQEMESLSGIVKNLYQKYPEFLELEESRNFYENKERQTNDVFVKKGSDGSLLYSSFKPDVISEDIAKYMEHEFSMTSSKIEKSFLFQYGEAPSSLSSLCPCIPSSFSDFYDKPLSTPKYLHFSSLGPHYDGESSAINHNETLMYTLQKESENEIMNLELNSHLESNIECSSSDDHGIDIMDVDNIEDNNGPLDMSNIETLISSSKVLEFDFGSPQENLLQISNLLLEIEKNRRNRMNSKVLSKNSNILVNRFGIAALSHKGGVLKGISLLKTPNHRELNIYRELRERLSLACLKYNCKLIGNVKSIRKFHRIAEFVGKKGMNYKGTTNPTVLHSKQGLQ